MRRLASLFRRRCASRAAVGPTFVTIDVVAARAGVGNGGEQRERDASERISHAVAWSVWRQPQPLPSDLAPVWAGARALLARQNPYEAVRPANPLSLGFPLMYPLTAVLTLTPVAVLPLWWVDPIFVGLGFALFT